MASRVASGNQRNGPITQCKICRRSIFNDDDKAWARDPAPGLVHTACLQRDKD